MGLHKTRKAVAGQLQQKASGAESKKLNPNLLYESKTVSTQQQKQQYFSV